MISGFTKEEPLYHRPVLYDIISREIPDAIFGAELGVRAGITSEYLMERLNKLTMICIDRWLDSPDNQNYIDTGDRCAKLSKEEATRYYFSTIERLYKFDSHAIIRMDMNIAHVLFKDGIFDFVFLDANHSFEATLRGLEDWSVKVKPGGLIMGHDYGGFGVTKAVNKFCNNHHIDRNSVHLEDQSVFWIKNTP